MSELVDHLAIHKTTTAIWQPGAYADLARAVRDLKRDLRGRDIRDVRPARSNWIVPDSVGFSLEGKSRDLARRKSHICGELEELACDRGRPAAQRRASQRVGELITASRSHPTWLYWYSPQTIALARRSSYETQFEVNQLATSTLRGLGIDVTISCWQEAIGVVSRRLPLGLVLANSPSRRCIQLVRKLERLGVLTVGGLTILSTDSLAFLRSIQLSTLEACSNALKDGYP